MSLESSSTAVIQELEPALPVLPATVSVQHFGGFTSLALHSSVNSGLNERFKFGFKNRSQSLFLLQVSTLTLVKKFCRCGCTGRLQPSSIYCLKPRWFFFSCIAYIRKKKQGRSTKAFPTNRCPGLFFFFGKVLCFSDKIFFFTDLTGSVVLVKPQKCGCSKQLPCSTKTWANHYKAREGTS